VAICRDKSRYAPGNRTPPGTVRTRLLLAESSYSSQAAWAINSAWSSLTALLPLTPRGGVYVFTVNLSGPTRL